MKLGMPVGLGPGHIALDGGPAPPPQSPQSAHVHCGQTARWIKMAVGMEVGLGAGLIVLDGDPAHSPKKRAEPQFSTRICCVQMAGWIKMPHGMEVGLGPGDFVLDGDPAPPSPNRGQSPIPNFRPISIVAKWLNGSRWQLAWRWPWCMPHCARWGPSPLPKKEGGAPQFAAHVYCGHTAECIKMPLGMEVGLSPGDFVLD